MLNSCVENKTLDNITAVLIGFKGLEKIIESKKGLGPLTETFLDWTKTEKDANDELTRLQQ